MSERLGDFFGDPGIITDPKTYLDQMRSRAPVLEEPYHGSVMITGYDQAMDVLTRRDDSFSSAVSVIGPIPPLPFTPEGDDITEQLEAHRDQVPWSMHLACFDGRKHAEHRALLTGLLTHRRLKDNEAYLHDLANRLIDGFIARGGCNIVPEYAHATTTFAISDLMGIPEIDRIELLELIGAPPSQIDGDGPKLGADPLIFLKPRFDTYLRDRLEQPTSDLMSELIHSRLKDGSTPDFDMVSGLARFLYGAGQDTTSRLIAMAVKVLAENPALQRRLHDTPERIPDFIEEVLRYDAPVKTVYRIARKSTTVDGLDVPAGTIITVVLTAGSNDPGHFANPETVDIDRSRLRDHLAFSRGAHGCLGAPLARLEARVAIKCLLSRIEDIRFSEEHHGPEDARQFRFEPTYSFRSLTDLHVAFSAI